MPEKPEHPSTPHFHVGMRMVKTVIAVFLSGLISYLLNRPAFYAIISALVCIQNSTGKTIQTSINRMIGTAIGGVTGIVVVYLLDALNLLQYELLRYAIVALMLIPIISLTLAIHRPTISSFTCVVFLCVIISPSAAGIPALYSAKRLLETLIGVVIACLVDLALPGHAPTQEGTSP